MKITRTKFIMIFLVSAFAFQFVSNSVLGPEIGLFPANGEWYPGIGSSTGWKNVLATILYPVKFILIEPLSFLGQDPDPAPPVLVIAFALYWTALALVLYYLRRVITRTKA
jgi:hypothetical protein